MAEQDDAQQGEGEQEEHRASAADGLTSVRDAAVRAMGLTEGLKGTLGLAEMVQRDMAPYAGMAESAQRWLAAQESIGLAAMAGAEQWRASLDRLGVSAEWASSVKENFNRLSVSAEYADRFKESFDRVSGIADLAQAMDKASKAHLSSLAQQIADLAANTGTSAWLSEIGEGKLARLYSFDLPEHLLSPTPQRPAEPRPALPAPQPPAPQKEVHLLQQLDMALRAGEIELSEVFEVLRLLSSTGKPKSKPGVQQTYTDEQYFALRLEYEQRGLSIDRFCDWLRDVRSIFIAPSGLKSHWKRLGLTNGRQGRQSELL